MNTKSRTGRFAICVSAAGDDVQKGKVYLVLEDSDAAQDGFFRVVDDSGEDYLYPASCFAFVTLPRDVQAALLSSG